MWKEADEALEAKDLCEDNYGGLIGSRENCALHMHIQGSGWKRIREVLRRDKMERPEDCPPNPQLFCVPLG